MEESYNWLLNIIDSCKNYFQLECCNKLVDYFNRMYTQENGFNEAHDKLLKALYDKDISLTV